METRIVGFKGSRRDVDNKYCIIEGDANPASLIGQMVRWQTQSGRYISGKVVRTHGSRGAMARFKRGLPGTALGGKVVVGRLPVVKEAPKKAPPARKEKPKAMKEKKPKVAEKPAKEKKALERAKKVIEKVAKKPKAKAKEKVKKAPAKKGESKSKSSKKK